MKLENRTIIIPWDFSESANNALMHAVQVAKSIENNIALLHISATEKLADEQLDNLKKTAEELEKKYEVPIQAIDKVGNIFETISYVAENEFNTSFVVMKVNPVKGNEKYWGSPASKVVFGSKTPFICIQEAPKRDAINNIVFPVDYRRENKEKLSWVLDLSKFYKTKLHIILPRVSDKTLLKEIKNNLAFSKRLLDAKHIDYSVQTVESKGKFAEQILEYSKEVNADLIVILISKFSGFKSWLFGIKDQYVIANKNKIPVMCLNPRSDFKKLGGFHG